ncbi:uncharacterized protein [Mytilus edulis]|uniref:uncharacterized protein n=1 Tax=Mytilus edulis TaxID=6550 RepID=UPI0039EDF4BD
MSGRACLNWKSVNSPLVSFHENHNFCRNPNSFLMKPWCYTDADRYRFEFCNVPLCGTCSEHLCQHGSTCVEDHGKFTCICNPGFLGAQCNIDMNECASNPCHNNGTCHDTANSYTCSCKAGYTGVNCETNIDECASNLCQNGTCTDKVNGYSCSCYSGFTGTHCSKDIDECASNPCQYGTCTDKVNGYSCSCYSGFTGTHCAKGVDECASQPCQNNGTCVDQHNGYTCFCLSGDTGQNCEKRSQYPVRPSVMLIKTKIIDEGIRLVEIPCFAEGVPYPIVKWDTVNGMFQANIKQVSHFLVIENVTTADAGFYMCSATNRAGSDVKVIHIQVIPKPERQYIAPLISAPFMIKVYYYTDANLVCNVTGYPTPIVKWQFNQIPQASTGTTFTVSRVTNSSTGLYSCIATNDAGTSQANIILKVTYDPPKILSPPLPSISTAGGSHNFTCRATGHPVPVITWTFDSFTRIPTGLPRHVTFENGAILKLVNMQDSGQLTCTAENEFGSDTKSTNVIVKHSTAVIG